MDLGCFWTPGRPKVVKGREGTGREGKRRNDVKQGRPRDAGVCPRGFGGGSPGLKGGTALENPPFGM